MRIEPESHLENEFLRQHREWKKNRLLSAAEPLSDPELALMKVFDAILLERAKKLREANPIPPHVDIHRFPLTQYRHLPRLLSEQDVRLGASRKLRRRIAYATWRELKAHCSSVIDQALRKTEDFEGDALAANQVRWSLALIWLAIGLFACRLPALRIAAGAMQDILFKLTPRAQVIELRRPAPSYRSPAA